MIEHVHDHITDELRQNARTDTVFIITALFLNIVVTIVSSSFAGEKEGDTNTLIMYAFIVFQIFINGSVIFGLLKGKRMRSVLLEGLMRMYRDQKVDSYYDESLLSSYSVRYSIFVLIIGLLAAISLVVPLILRYA